MEGILKYINGLLFTLGGTVLITNSHLFNYNTVTSHFQEFFFFFGIIAQQYFIISVLILIPAPVLPPRSSLTTPWYQKSPVLTWEWTISPQRSTSQGYSPGFSTNTCSSQVYKQHPTPFGSNTVGIFPRNLMA